MERLGNLYLLRQSSIILSLWFAIRWHRVRARPAIANSGKRLRNLKISVPQFMSLLHRLIDIMLAKFLLLSCYDERDPACFPIFGVLRWRSGKSLGLIVYCGKKAIFYKTSSYVIFPDFAYPPKTKEGCRVEYLSRHFPSL
ncbi:hypothetical protein BDZ91DRAFT_717175 [Kalaharituber pfeilii]|nr:hypothetical protein BDZ91DRAFT_717175 [Kalaharituber pfeilii]